MTSRRGLSGLLTRILSVVTDPPARKRKATTGAAATSTQGATATIEVAPPEAAALRIDYAPDRDGNPDAGEIVWTWVPYAENDGRGKDRPVLVIGRHTAERVFAVRLTSRAHARDRHFLEIGAGPWDSSGRPSWVDIAQIYSVHVKGMRREASALDVGRFGKVADALHQRYGWVRAL